MPRPVTVHEVPVEKQVGPPLEVTAYPVMVEPPLDGGAVQVTPADWLPGIAVTLVGAPGEVEGVAPAEGVEELPVPEALVAVTVKV